MIKYINKINKEVIEISKNNEKGEFVGYAGRLRLDLMDKDWKPSIIHNESKIIGRGYQFDFNNEKINWDKKGGKIHKDLVLSCWSSEMITVPAQIVCNLISVKSGYEKGTGDHIVEENKLATIQFASEYPEVVVNNKIVKI